MNRNFINLSKYTPFQKKVWEAVRSIPRGETRSYKWVAEKAGHPQAVRAVGQALKKNPWLGVIPCHRVICSNGSLGGFSQGLKKKKELLRAEGIENFVNQE